MSTPDASIDRSAPVAPRSPFAFMLSASVASTIGGFASLGMSFVAACIPVVFYLALGQRAARHSSKEIPA